MNQAAESHVEFLQFSNNCYNICCLLTKLLAYCPVAHPGLVQMYSYSMSLVSLGSSLLLARVEEFESDTVCNEFKQVQLPKYLSHTMPFSGFF